MATHKMTLLDVLRKGQDPETDFLGKACAG